MVSTKPCPPSEAHVFWHGLSCIMTYFAYLDEFGHVGPYISSNHAKHNESPVFGLAGFVLPSSKVRGFGTWFFQRKCELLHEEIERSRTIPARWEKKGTRLYTAKNVRSYRPLRVFANRLFNRIQRTGGFIFYVGTTKPNRDLSSNQLYRGVFVEAIKRIDQFCDTDPHGPHDFALILDEHEQRSNLVTVASIKMYARTAERRRHLVEPPFHLESHRYQTLQAADWISAIVGRLGALWTRPDEYPENKVFETYFQERLNLVSLRSSIRQLPG